MFKRLALLALSITLTTSFAFAAPPKGAMPPLPPQPKVRPAGLPAGYMMVSPCVASMGEHWANLKSKTFLTDPIYGTYQGKVIFSEIMVTLKQLQKGYTFMNLRALPGHAIDHVDFEFEPHGHEGMPFPHYDVHAYYISPAAVAKVCPSGVPNPAMKPSM